MKYEKYITSALTIYEKYMINVFNQRHFLEGARPWHSAKHVRHLYIPGVVGFGVGRGVVVGLTGTAALGETVQVPAT